MRSARPIETRSHLAAPWVACLVAGGLLAGCFGVDAADRAALNADAGIAAAPSTQARSGQPDGATPGTGLGSDGGVSPPPAVDAGVPGSADGGSPDAASGTDAAADDGGYTYPVLASNCAAPYTDPLRYHDLDYADSALHSLDAKLARDNCKSCHGDKLEGCARAPSCNGCHSGGHEPGWQTNCVYCHGGADNTTGAPPRFLDDTDFDRGANTFLVHTAHVAPGDHPAYDCVQCHVKPVDVLAPKHMFDLEAESPGRAEVSFAGGLAKAGSFSGGTCSNLYCHGNGRTNGTVQHTQTDLTCTSCHADRSQPTQLGGSHASHLTTTEGGAIHCNECHGDVVSSDTVITGKARHVDGRKDVKMPSGITMDNTKTCTGSCHGFTHGGLFFPTRTW